MTYQDFTQLNAKLATLNTQADTALSNGDRAAYQKIVDHMIDLENAHLDAGSELGADEISNLLKMRAAGDLMDRPG
jgi:hypothetical protein